MKIVFWSPVHGQTGMTSNILALSLVSAVSYKKKCLVTQTHFNYNNLEAPLIERNSKAAPDYFLDVGIDALVRNFKAERLNRKLVENCCITLGDTNLSLLPGTTKTNRESFDYAVGMAMPKVFLAMEQFYDCMFIDANPGGKELSLKLMEDAELTVINLSQNLEIIDLYFRHYDKLISGRKFFLFGAYDAKSKYNINNLRRKYKSITKSNSGVIPYNTAYKDAQADSRVADFIKKNINVGNLNDNYYFMEKTISAAGKILGMAERQSAGRLWDRSESKIGIGFQDRTGNRFLDRTAEGYRNRSNNRLESMSESGSGNRSERESEDRFGHEHPSGGNQYPWGRRGLYVHRE